MTQLQAELQKKNRQIDNLENTLSKTSTEIEKLKKDVAELRKVRPALQESCCRMLPEGFGVNPIVVAAPLPCRISP